MTKRILHAIAIISLILSPIASGDAFAQTEKSIIKEQQAYLLTKNDFTCDKEECLSRQTETRASFQNIAFEWQGDPAISIRLHDHGIWSSWRAIEGEKDAPDTEVAPPNSQLITTSPVDGFQIKTSNPQPETVSIKLFYVPELVEKKSDLHISANEDPSSLAIVPRSQWLNSGIELPLSTRTSAWPQEYAGVKKIVIHHTANILSDVTGDGVIDGRDYEQTARAIYTYHAKVRNWGDIGYNYVIDPLGTIWEGREGGDGVTAGHTYRDNSCKKFTSPNLGFNQGTIGIAMLGEFSSTDITPEARASLTSLIAKKTRDFGFDPSGASFFMDQTYPNVVGHRDLDCTECPGSVLYGNFSGIIAEAKNKYDQLLISNPKVAAAQIIDVAPREVDLKKGEEKTITITAQNTGTIPWRNYGDDKVQVALASIKEGLASLDNVSIAAEERDEKAAPNTQDASSSLMLAKLNTPNVYPGQTGTFTVTVKDPPSDLISKRKFVMALGMRGWFPGSDTEITIVNNGLEWAGLLDTGTVATRMLDNTKTPTVLTFQNKGMNEWKRGEVKLAIVDASKKTSSLKDASWKKPDGQFDFVENSVKPGETATFKVALFSSSLGGATQALALYQNKKKITGTDYSPLAMTVNPGYAAEVVSQSLPEKMTTGQKATTAITIRNIGGLTWKAASLSVHDKNGTSLSPFRVASWKSGSIVETAKNIKPGETVSFIFDMKGPVKVGDYTQKFAIKEGSKTFYISADNKLQKNLAATIKVEKPIPPPKVPAKTTIKKK